MIDDDAFTARLSLFIVRSVIRQHLFMAGFFLVATGSEVSMAGLVARSILRAAIGTRAFVHQRRRHLACRLPRMGLLMFGEIPDCNTALFVDRVPLDESFGGQGPKQAIDITLLVREKRGFYPARAIFEAALAVSDSP